MVVSGLVIQSFIKISKLPFSFWNSFSLIGVSRDEIRPKSTVQAVAIAKERLKCQHCDKTYSKLSNLNNHIESKHKLRRFNCTICNKPLSSKFAFDRHMKNKHNQKEAVNAYANESYILDRSTVATERALVEKIKVLEKSNSEKDSVIASLKQRLGDTENNES